MSVENIVYSTGLGGSMNLLESKKKMAKLYGVDEWQFIDPISPDEYDYDMDEEFAISMEDQEVKWQSEEESVNSIIKVR